MPFPDVTKHNVTRNFEQVLNAILQKSRILLKIEDLIPDSDGWTLADDLAALEQMVGESSDKLWAEAFTTLPARIAALEAIVNDPDRGNAALALIVSRIDEHVSSLQVGG